MLMVADRNISERNVGMVIKRHPNVLAGFSYVSIIDCFTAIHHTQYSTGLPTSR